MMLANPSNSGIISAVVVPLAGLPSSFKISSIALANHPFLAVAMRRVSVCLANRKAPTGCNRSRPDHNAWRCVMAGRNNTATETHKQLIGLICERFPGAQTKGFKAAYRQHEARLGVEEPSDHLVGFIPDAYRINAEQKAIEIFEVEVSSYLSQNKVALLGHLWFAWDSEDNGWTPVLYLVDRYGTLRQINLEDAYYGTGPFALARLNGALDVSAFGESRLSLNEGGGNG